VWRWSAGGSATRVHTEHPALEEETRPYWHVMDVTLSETRLTTAVGLARGVGLELTVPFRTATSRIHFEDAARAPFVPAEPDLHHRDETIAGSGDPWLILHAARTGAVWTAAARVGVSIPLGRTEPDPFDLGRRGLPHQHLQLGTGTWDPVLGLAAGRRLGSFSLTAITLARLGLEENDRGYRPGHRFQAGLSAERPLAGVWRVSSGVEVAREEPERWHGVVEEEEGNLGRTDLLLTVGVMRPLASLGGLRIAVSVPIVTRTRGAQLDYPLIVSVGVSR
jgi:hypothetical protein